MQRLASAVRPDWQRRVEEHGLVFHTTDDGKPYWDESAYYAFTAAEIDALEAATYALDKLCLQAVEHIVNNGRFADFHLPAGFVPWIRRAGKSRSRPSTADSICSGTAPGLLS